MNHMTNLIEAVGHIKGQKLDLLFVCLTMLTSISTANATSYELASDIMSC